MCIIIHKPAHSRVCPSIIKLAYENNMDGFGLMFPHNGKIKVIKGMFDLVHIQTLIEKYRTKNLAIHFRYRTKGSLDLDNCHPFKVLDKRRDGRDLYLMHNGTIHDMGNAKISDTQEFANELRDTIQQANYEKAIKHLELIENFVGKNNKMILMDDTGQVNFINKDQGFNFGDVWFSNSYSLKKDYRKDMSSFYFEKTDRETQQKSLELVYGPYDDDDDNKINYAREYDSDEELIDENQEDLCNEIESLLEEMEVHTDSDVNNIIINILESYNINTTYAEIDLVKEYFRRKHNMSIIAFYDLKTKENYYSESY